MNHKLLGCAVMLVCAGSSALAASWRVCVPDSVLQPLVTRDAANPGVLERLLVNAGRDAGLAVELVFAPPPRCLALLERGEVEINLAPPTLRNQQSMQFPMLGSDLDASRYLFRTNFVLIRRNDSPMRWNGKTFSGSDAGHPFTVGTRRHFSAVVERLLALDVRVDTSALSARQVLDMLALQRFDVAVLMGQELQQEQQRGLPPGLSVMELPLLSAAIFAVPSLKTWADQPRQVQAWWDAIARMRDLPAYRSD